MFSKDNTIEELELTINNLKSALTLEKNKNFDLTKENNKKKQKVSQLQSQINSQNNLEKSNNISNIENNLYDQLIKLNMEKENKIKELKEIIKRYPFILQKHEKIMSIIFCSFDGKINYSMICKNTDNIHKLEEKLYDEYPELSETDNNFKFKGKKLNKFQTFEKYNIKNGDVIILNQNNSS